MCTSISSYHNQEVETMDHHLWGSYVHRSSGPVKETTELIKQSPSRHDYVEDLFISFEMPGIKLLTTPFDRSHYSPDYRLIFAYLIRLKDSVKGMLKPSWTIFIVNLYYPSECNHILI